LGDLYDILRCVGVIRVVEVIEVIEVIEVSVRVIEVRVNVGVKIIAMFESCVLKDVVWGSKFLI
jgi:hypothetical protein